MGEKVLRYVTTSRDPECAGVRLPGVAGEGEGKAPVEEETVIG